MKKSIKVYIPPFINKMNNKKEIDPIWFKKEVDKIKLKRKNNENN